MSVGLDSARPQGRKNRPPLFSYAYRSPGRSRSFLQEAAREKPGNKSVDGRVWNCVLYPPPVNRSFDWIVNHDDSVPCDSMFAIKRGEKREKLDWPHPLVIFHRRWISMIEGGWKKVGSLSDSIHETLALEWAKANLKSGKVKRERVKSVSRIHRLEISVSFIRCLVARPFPPLDIAWSAEIPGIVFVPFCRLFSAHFHLPPVLDCPSPSLFSPFLPFSSLLARLWIPGRERRAGARGKAAVRVEEKREMVEEEENKRGVSHPSARKLSSKSAPLSAPGNPREVRASAEIIEFLLLGRPLSTGSPSLLLSTLVRSLPPKPAGIHIYPRFFLGQQAYYSSRFFYWTLTR